MVGRLSIKKRMVRYLMGFVIVFIGLAVHIIKIQFVDGEKLSQLAYEQQTLDRKITPKRGKIYDSSGKIVLAESIKVQAITVNPNRIKDKEKVAKKLSELFNLDYDKVLKKISKKVSIVDIAKKVDNETSNELRKWLKENDIKEGVNIDEDTMRVYPNNNLASQVIGFCGSDNQGLNGIEAEYDEILKGENGSISKLTDATGKRIKNTSEEYKDPIDGNDLVLTIDFNIQSIAEKYLKQACIDNNCTDGGNVIVMNPQNGEILALAGYPNYNLNKPFEVEGEYSKEEKNKIMQMRWRNKAISDTYEPGSTFKIVTASASLEEKITTTDKKGEFCCIGHIEVAGVRMKCWRYYKPHGSESLREALMNSCNPVFIGLGEKLGVKKYYSYLNKFGFFKKTGIDLPGEANSIFLKENKVGPVELGTIAFGQRFEVTPIQMATMLSTIGNGGVYVKPHLVKQIIKKDEVENIEKEEGERVISEENAKNILSMMESVVKEGTGKKAQVEGYSIGGKTGTSEDGVNTGKYIASFIGIAPIENPQLVVLAILYNPKGEGGHSGGGLGAPLAGSIFKETLEYLK